MISGSKQEKEKEGREGGKKGSSLSLRKEKFYWRMKSMYLPPEALVFSTWVTASEQDASCVPYMLFDKKRFCF